jgi:hypothetical protein
MGIGIAYSMNTIKFYLETEGNRDILASVGDSLQF